MYIDVALVPVETEEYHQLGRAAVLVIDALRASSTIVTALHAGATSVVPVAAPEEARHLAEALGDGAVLGGERGGLALPGFDMGNSPLEYTPEHVAGKVVVITTTNGTLALRSVQGAASVATGAFLNAAAVVRWAKAQLVAGRDLLMACAGVQGRFAWEDASFAGLVVAELKRQVDKLSLTDGARAAEHIWLATGEDPLAALRMSSHGIHLADLGFAADLDYCARLSVIDAVPQLWEGRLLLRE